MSAHRDIDAELRFHFEARIEELVAQGMSHDEARARANAEFGDVDATRRSLREIDSRIARRRNRAEVLDGMLQDVRYAARSLWRTPAVSITIILTLALGLGVNAAMFSLLDVIFLRPPAGVVRPAELRRVWSERTFRDGTRFWPGFDFSQFSAVARQLEGQADLIVYGVPSQRKLGHGETAPKASVAAASATYFSVLGVKPQLGRFYTTDEDRVETLTPVAVVSDAFWKREFGGDAATVIGRQITIDDQRLTVIGVAPAGFSGTELTATDVWLPMTTSLGPRASLRKPWWQNPNINGFQVVLRLHPGAPESELAQRATAALRRKGIGWAQDTATVAAFGSIIAARGPGTLKAETAVATRLGGVALIVLVIACANVINLLLARAVKRRKEIAVRLALGISRARLIRMLVIESVLLSLLATVAAILAGQWGGALLRVLLMPEVRFAASPLDGRVFAFSLALAIAAGALAGLVPALQSASPELTSALKAGSRDGVSHRSRLRNALIVCQAALSVMLLIGAVLFVRSLHNVKQVDIGYAVDRLAFATIRFDTRDSARDAALGARIRALAPRLASIPGVQAVGFTGMRPKFGISWTDFFPDVDTVAGKKPSGFYTAVSPNYFSVVGTRLIRGRTFDPDPMRSLPPTVIVDQAMAERVWPNTDPIGHCVHFDSPNAPCATVIGVVQTNLFQSVNEKPEPRFYVSLDHPPFKAHDESEIVLRAPADRLVALQKSVAELLRAEFPGAIPITTTMSAVMEPEYRPWQLGATLFSLFGGLALLVAGIGIFSTVSYAVSQRTHEFGVRVALGARASDVLGQVLGEGLRVVAVGVVTGIIMAYLSGRLLASLLYGIAPTDPLTMLIVAVILMGIAAIAALLPAWRASRADPVAALRTD
ncbi:MAG: ADOP family duplicated permease [Gemmatimonadaceae bacterium]